MFVNYFCKMCNNKLDMLAVIFGLLCVILSVDNVAGGSCREAGLCCNGRDSSCVVQKAPLNSIIEDLNDKPCYCDHACLKLGDCCDDFKAHCGVIDCVLSDWGSWSECDTKCGPGIMSRTRTIIKASENGGKRCPSLVQKRGCQGYKCHNHHDRRALKETAMLLPSIYSKHRHENDTVDIRRNLRLRYKDYHRYNREHEYCVEFEVMKVTKACQKMPPYDKLIEGDRIVVRCDVEAFSHDDKNEDGVNPKENEVGEPVHSYNKNSENETYEKEKREVKPIKYRCKGEGLIGRNTRFSSFAAPSCRGKWMRLSNQTKKCKIEPQFIFV